jgi:hypothetical protein
MFISLGQRVDTDNEYTRIRSNYTNDVGLGPRITIAFGYGDALRLDIAEARTLALELEQALRDAWSDDAEGIA